MNIQIENNSWDKELLEQLKKDFWFQLMNKIFKRHLQEKIKRLNKYYRQCCKKKNFQNWFNKLHLKLTIKFSNFSTKECTYSF